MDENNNDLSSQVEVFGFRQFPGGNRLGYFKIKIYVSNSDWFDVDSFKLMANTDTTKPDEYYVLPPAEKDKNGGFRNYAQYSLGLKQYITKKAIELYKSSVQQ